MIKPKKLGCAIAIDFVLFVIVYTFFCLSSKYPIITGIGFVLLLIAGTYLYIDKLLWKD